MKLVNKLNFLLESNLENNLYDLGNTINKKFNNDFSLSWDINKNRSEVVIEISGEKEANKSDYSKVVDIITKKLGKPSHVEDRRNKYFIELYYDLD